jgi:hypothetical protein
VLRIRVVYPGSRIQGQKDSGLTQKLFLSSWKYDPGCSSRVRIRILISYPSRGIPAPGGQKGTGSATLLFWCRCICLSGVDRREGFTRCERSYMPGPIRVGNQGWIPNQCGQTLRASAPSFFSLLHSKQWKLYRQSPSEGFTNKQNQVLKSQFNKKLGADLFTNHWPR